LLAGASASLVVGLHASSASAGGLLTFETYLGRPGFDGAATKVGDVITTQYGRAGVTFRADGTSRPQIEQPVTGTQSPTRALGLRRYMGATVGTWLSTASVKCGTAGMGRTPSLHMDFSPATASVSLYTGKQSSIGPALNAVLVGYAGSGTVTSKKPLSLSGIRNLISVSSAAGITHAEIYFEAAVCNTTASTVPMPVIDNLAW
jgi:hypothetical protein